MVARVAVLLALVSSAVWGTADFGGGLLSRRLPAAAVTAWSQTAGMLAAVLAVTVLHAWQPVGAWTAWSVMAGACGALGLVLFYRALATGTMGVVSPIAALGAVVPVGAGLLAGERPSSLQVVGIVVALTGAVLASGPELAGGAGAESVVLAAAAGALFGGALLGIQHGAQQASLLTLAGMRATSVVGFLTVALLRRTLGGVRGGDLPALAAVGVADVLANLCYAVATTIGLVSVVSVLSTLYPVATVLLARWVLRERLRLVQLVGVGVALGGVALLAAG